MHTTFSYNAKQTTRQVDEIIRIFSRETIKRLQDAGNTSSTPIFVVGMPRSGTTLTEQIIASHPDVHGAGELADMSIISERNVGQTAGFPHNILALDHQTLKKWADEYVAGLCQRAPNSLHITDKLPGNLLIIGLIHVMLPNAKIIHVSRNPVDTCLSCFMTFFSQGALQQTYDLRELGLYYSDYIRLMNHWRKLLPAGAFLDICYEDIVADQETQAKRLISYCGLEWNNACINFHQTKRTVSTASMMQVRRPITILL
jgi:hypothetical protein